VGYVDRVGLGHPLDGRFEVCDRGVGVAAVGGDLAEQDLRAHGIVGLQALQRRRRLGLRREQHAQLVADRADRDRLTLDACLVDSAEHQKCAGDVR